MDDYISRQAAINAIQQHREDVLGSYEYDEDVAFVYAAAHNHIAEVIKRLPSADVAPVRHGRWIKFDDDDRISGICSDCGWESHLYEDDVVGMPYCPNCGARMDGEKNG